MSIILTGAAYRDTVLDEGGGLDLIRGCMFSGKTTLLLHKLQQCRPAEVIVFKHRLDDRYSLTRVMSHDHIGADAVVVDSASHIATRLTDARIVAIDEGHFYEMELARLARRRADEGRRVIITALDLDSWGRPFQTVAEVSRLADRIVQLHAVCPCCGAMADHTQRLTSIVDGNMVGGPEAYEPRCGRCFRPPPEPSPGTAGY